MTQEDKELLLKDLCARLPYGIKVNNEIQGDFKIYGICENFVFGRNEVCHIDFDVEKIKPYLFPLSSMTEEQILAFWKIEFKDNGGFENDWDFPLYPPKVGNHFIIEALDWLNRNHFDYRGLIEKGLAIDATKLNIY